jgi:hypothetical protein
MKPTVASLGSGVEQPAALFRAVADGDAFKVFKGAIDAALSKYQPSGEAAGPTGRLQSMFGTDATPEAVGRILTGVTGTFRWREAGQSERERYGKPQTAVDKQKG